MQERISKGKLFHTSGAAKLKDFSPKVASFLTGLNKRNLSDDLKVRDGE